MDDTKHKEPAYSSERITTATAGEPPEPTPAEKSSGGAKNAPSLKQPQQSQVAAFPEPARSVGSSPLAEFMEFLRRTRRVWLGVAGAIFGLMVVVTLVQRVSEWARNTRERRQEQAVASVTPDRLIARCGQPTADVTKEVYPILMRTMSYQSRENQTLVFAFSRTAEEQSDWVFLSMKDQSGAKSYDTPEAKTAALPCLDSRK